MEINDGNLTVLLNILKATLSPDSNAIKEAEKYVRSIESTPGFIIMVLHLLSKLLPSNDVNDKAIRLAAAVLFKNSVKRCWMPVMNSDQTYDAQPIADVDRDTIKSHLIDLMCTTPPDVQRQLSEAVSIIAKYDFPQKWNGLLPQLMSKLTSTDMSVLKGVMLTFNSIMKKFRYVMKTDPILLELQYCLKFHDQLLACYQQNQLYIQEFMNSNNIVQLELVLETRRLITRIYYSYNWLDLPEEFEDNMEAWMNQFAWSLEFNSPSIKAQDDSPGPMERLQASVIENLNLYAGKYDEEFEPYLGRFIQIVWQLLMRVDNSIKFDILANNGMKFLTAISSKQRNVQLFSEPVLRDIVQHIVVRSLTASETDEELFEDNPTDYIRKDMEGSDQDTRRRCATELLRGLLKFFNVPVSQLCTAYVAAMLQSYNSTQDWKAKDAALHLVLAACVMSSSATGGATTLNPNINILEIFTSHVLPEINDANVNARPIVKADAIKMICVFRSHLQTPMMLDILPHLIRHLSSKYIVVQTYSALCIERFLTVKDRTVTDEIVGGHVQLRVTKQHLMPYVQQLFSGLFAVLENPELPENDYVIKCIMRILSILGMEVRPVIELTLSKLVAALERVSKNPTNPLFNHYIFESLACLVKAVCFPANVAGMGSDPASTIAACNQFELLLFPPFQAILALDVVEFVPYVFQILAQLLSARPVGSGLSPPYQALFPPLLAPSLWERKGNVPALIDLFKAYVIVGMKNIVASGSMEGVLGVFQKLLSLKSTEVHAFTLLNGLIQYNSYEVLASFANGSAIPAIFGLLLTRMRDQMTDSNKSPKYCRYFLHTMCLFAAQYGGVRLYETLETITPGLSTMIIMNVWSHNVQSCYSLEKVEIKEMIVGATNLFLDTPLINNSDVWLTGMVYITTLIDQADSSGYKSTDVDDLDQLFGEDEAQSREFDSTYSKLAYALLSEPPIAPEYATASKYFISRLSSFTSTYPGKYLPLIQKLTMNNPEQGKLLEKLVQSNGVQLL